MSNYYRAYILIVEDDELAADLMSEVISGFYTFDIVTTGIEAMAYCESKMPDLILMDIKMPSMDGLTACKLLRQQESTKYIPILIVTAHTELTYEDLSWEAGCSDFVAKPFSSIALRHRIKHHLDVKLLTDKLQTLASIDGLTGIQNRQSFNEYLSEQARLSQRSKTPLGLLMIDIDYFKEFNDTYGHLGGDECLKDVASAILKCLVRPTDHVARYGGEEFAVLLPDTGIEGIKHVAESIMATVKDMNIVHQAAPIGTLTISIGGASFCPGQSHIKELIETADNLLYKAKKAGRNCVVIMDEN